MNDNNTMCHKLWDEVYIDYTGNIYPCCHEKPEPIGNIYNDKFEDIVNNDIIKKYRYESLNGQLSCFKTCNLNPNKCKINIDEKDKLRVTANFNILKILFGERCNINCIMCWQNSNKKELLDFDVLKKQLDIKKFKHVLIQGGEPFYCKEALDFYNFVVENGVKASFLTNGLLLNEEWAKKIAKNSVFIHISINAASKKTHESINVGSSWEKVLYNVQLLRKYKEKYKSNLQIQGHMTIIERNVEEISLYLRNFEKLGFDMARFGYDQGMISYLNSNEELRLKLKIDIENALKECNISKVDLTRLRMLKLI